MKTMSKIHSENNLRLKIYNIMMILCLSNTGDNNNIKGRMIQFHNNIGDNNNIKDKIRVIFHTVIIQDSLLRSFILMLLLWISQKLKLSYGMFISLILLH